MFDLTKVASSLRKGSTVLLEGPPGFVQYLPRLAAVLHDCRPDIGVYVRLEPAYGSCDLGFEHARTVNADTIVHVGHDPYPYPITIPWGLKVMYVRGDFVFDDRDLEVAKRFILNANDDVAVLASVQHMDLARTACMHAVAEGGKCTFVDEPVLGCYAVPHVKSVLSSTAGLLIAGGVFHAVSFGLNLVKYGLKLLDRIYLFDPYTDTLIQLKHVVEPVLRQRYYRILEARNARSFGIVVGSKPGQLRKWLVDYLSRLLKARGYRYQILIANRLTPSDLDNLKPNEVDAFIVTSCPYIPLDDMHSYVKPVLTPGEARMLLTGRLEPYLYPW